MDQLRSETIGEYDIIRRLGRGGMASVYLAHDIALDRKVAIKVMSPELRERPDMVERFMLEARTAASLSHPNIIPIYAVKLTDSLMYFAMKFVEGRPLDDAIPPEGGLPIGLVRMILGQIASGLHYAHMRKIVHRDVKPANIILDNDGWAVITDFGIAKVAESGNLTQTGMTVGTPAYMSPEQCSGSDITGASDQYSLGVVAYELLTSRRPFKAAESFVEVVWSRFHQDPEDVRKSRADCPADLAHCVARMLSREPSDRWAGLGEVAGLCAGKAQATDRDMAELVARSPAQALDFSTPLSPVPTGRFEGEATRPIEQPEAKKVVSLKVYPRRGVMTVGDWAAVQAEAVADNGTPLVRDIEIKSSDSSVVRVEGESLYALNVGSSMVQVSCEGITEEIAIKVTRVGVHRLEMRAPSTSVAGTSTELEAYCYTRFGDELRGRIISWTSSDPTIASVSSEGRMVALRDGVVEICARSGGREERKRIRIAPPSITGIRVEPSRVSIAAGQYQQIEANVLSLGGRVLEGVEVEWQSSNEEVATVDDGLVVALRPGSARVAAICGGKKITAAIEVTP